MLARSTLRALSLAAVVPVLAAYNPKVPSPFLGQTRYLCCNLHYDRDTISDVNYQQGTLVPLGTPVRITDVRAKSITFEPEGQPPLPLALKYGRRQTSIDELFSRYFLETDPRRQLARLPAETRALIETGDIANGMTKDEVLMALGYPPAHRTPSLEAPIWTYWQNRWHEFTVYFEGDRVARFTPR
jgi:hypothetical protein